MNKPVSTFFSKNATTCPGCGCEFKKEELQTGRGRLNAGDLTKELRRNYIPTQKYGVITPLIYPIAVCPECLFSGLNTDFEKIPAENKTQINGEKENRHQLIIKTFGTSLDFKECRSIVTGLASYILAFASTIHLTKYLSPTARRGLYALRGAWLSGDIYNMNNISFFQELQKNLYYQAYLNYDQCIEKQIKNIEPFDGFTWMGPDIDTNFGYDGLLYITSYLNVMHLEYLTPSEQIIKIAQIKRVLSKIFGVGKSNKDKPKVLVDNAKELYQTISDLLVNIENDGFDISSASDSENDDTKE